MCLVENRIRESGAAKSLRCCLQSSAREPAVDSQLLNRESPMNNFYSRDESDVEVEANH